VAEADVSLLPGVLAAGVRVSWLRRGLPEKRRRSCWGAPCDERQSNGVGCHHGAA
jgi:hypothetical protein